MSGTEFQRPGPSRNRALLAGSRNLLRDTHGEGAAAKVRADKLMRSSSLIDTDEHQAVAEEIVRLQPNLTRLGI